MGARLLREWIVMPLIDPAEILARQSAVAELVEVNHQAREAAEAVFVTAEDFEVQLLHLAQSGTSSR